jgi:hypothetical protein
MFIETGTRPEHTMLLKEGRYRKVNLVESAHDNNGDSPRNGGGMLDRIFHRHATTIPSFLSRYIIANAVVSGEVDKQQLEKLPKENSLKASEELSKVVVSIANRYRRDRRFKGNESTDEEGLILSDFFEIIPVRLAARMMLAISNPDITRDLASDPDSIDVAIDTQQCAVMTVALLPQTVRRDLFQEMAELSGGIQGGAYRFFALFASNWSALLSDYCGQTLIDRSFSDEKEREAKKTEVADDLRYLGPLLRLSKSKH